MPSDAEMLARLQAMASHGDRGGLGIAAVEAIRWAVERIAELWRAKTGEADLQSDLVEGLRAAAAERCVCCRMGHPADGALHVWTVDRVTYRADCLAVDIRALLARVDAEIAAKGTERTPCP